MLAYAARNTHPKAMRLSMHERTHDMPEYPHSLGEEPTTYSNPAFHGAMYDTVQIRFDKSTNFKP